MQLRKDYAKGELDENSVQANPVKQFEKWFHEALNAELPEPNAMALATANKEGQPSVRIVLLRGFDDRGFTFFTNYESAKGQQIADNPAAALNFFWPELERQIRIEGRVEFVSEEESDNYYNRRPANNRLSAWASPQSSEIPNREFLSEMMDEFREKYGEEEIPRPDHWGGYRVVPQRIEFWQGRPSRLHDRVTYLRQADNSWKIVRLAP